MYILALSFIGGVNEYLETTTDQWQTLSHNVVSSTPRHEWGLNFSGDRYWLHMLL